MQDILQVGDVVQLIDLSEGYECETTNNHEREFVALRITSLDGDYIVRAKWIDSKGEIVGGTCCSLSARLYRKVSASNLMKTLVNITPEQRKGLSKEDQALRELGVINDVLQLVDQNYIIAHYFETNRSAIAAQATKDVAEIKAELKKTVK